MMRRMGVVSPPAPAPDSALYGHHSSERGAAVGRQQGAKVARAREEEGGNGGEKEGARGEEARGEEAKIRNKKCQ